MNCVDGAPAELSMPPLGGLSATENGLPDGRDLVDSYRRLADVFHHVLSEHSLDTLLDRIADTLSDLIPYDTLSIFQADEAQTDRVRHRPGRVGRGTPGAGADERRAPRPADDGRARDPAGRARGLDHGA